MNRVADVTFYPLWLAILAVLFVAAPIAGGLVVVTVLVGLISLRTRKA
ncbi:MAG TPA: hypothetical protein VG674_16655 [Amycolatopsis sp.]|nr:hypothetical protein [Amycolatopsis sp.]